MHTILFAGGGTLGPVTPLLAVAARMKEARPDLRFAWAGTDSGPEREIVEAQGIPFATVSTARLPRYATLKLLTAPFDYLRARRDARAILDHVHPSLVLSAGGFTAVPVILEAAARHRPCIAHQLDYAPGLSNRMTASHCRYVTTSFEYPHPPFGTGVVTYHVPTPTRYALADLPERRRACQTFGFDPFRPIVLVTGGGTGAKTLNEAFYSVRSQLPDDVQVLHLTGRGKAQGIVSEGSSYIVKEFLAEEMLHAYAAADIVVSRAGVGAISELAALKKAAILVPLPDSPQEKNAEALNDSVVVCSQKQAAFAMDLADHVTKLLADTSKQKRLGEALHKQFPTDRGEALANLALSVLH